MFVVKLVFVFVNGLLLYSFIEFKLLFVDRLVELVVLLLVLVG